MYKARKRSKDEDNIILVSNRKGNVSREKELITEDLLELTSTIILWTGKLIRQEFLKFGLIREVLRFRAHRSS